MQKLLRLSLIAIAIISFSSISAQTCNGRYQADIFSSVDVSTVQFGVNVNDAGDTIDLFMDIYQPQGDTASNRPLVLLTFGGSFTGGSRNSGELVFMATELAKKGYVCASIDYRVTSNVLNLINEEKMVKVVFGAVQDGKAAIRFFRKDFETTNTYRISTEDIFIGGTSAGGILALNLAYVTDVNQLPSNWQTWADEIGGVEGNSGNPGYCSQPNGAFGFAGAVGDTSWIAADDVPFYGSHATGDQTVLYGYGSPLNGLAPVNLYGSGLIETRMANLGTYFHLDTYSGGDHPPLAGSNQIMADTKDSLATFLYNIITCNPNNQRKSDQIDCAKIATSTTSIDLNSNTLILFPNPAQEYLNFGWSGAKVDQAVVLNTVGEKVKLLSQDELNSGQIDVSQLAVGLYILQLHVENGTVAKKFFIE